MNKKILVILIVLMAVVSVASVCASDLTKEQDFDGKFKMNISGNATFAPLTKDLGGGEFVSNMSWTDNKTAIVCYYESGMNEIVPIIRSNTLFLTEPKVDGNLTIFEDTTSQDNAPYAVKYFVGVQSPDNKTSVFVASDDLNLAKEYASSISFD